MDMITGIRERRSIRKFEDRPIPREILMEAAADAAYAPSWKNTQTVRYHIVDSPEILAALATDQCMLDFSYNTKTVGRSPALIILTSIQGLSGYEKDGSFSTPKGDRWEMFDAGIAAQTFCLAAHARGIGTTILGYFDEEAIRRIVPIPEDQRISALIVAGFPAAVPKTPKRLDADQLVWFH